MLNLIYVNVNFVPTKNNGDKGTRCERTPFMGYPVRVTVQNKPVNLDNAPHHLYIAHIGRRGEAVLAYMTFIITRKPLRIELTYLKLQTENADTFGLGCSTMIIMVFESTNKIFSSGFNIEFVIATPVAIYLSNSCSSTPRWR